MQSFPPPRSTQHGRQCPPRRKAPRPFTAFLNCSLPPNLPHHPQKALSSLFVLSSAQAHLIGGHGDILLFLGHVGGAGEAVQGGGPVGAGLLARLRHRHAEARRRHGRGRHGGCPELHAAAGGGGRDDVRHRPVLPAALRHRLRAPLHLLPAQPALDRPRLPLHGDGGRVHGGAAGAARAPGEVHRRGVDPGRHGGHHGHPGAPERVPLHATLHHPRGRHDGRQRHDRHRRHHEEAPRGRQDPEDPRGDGAGAGGDAGAGDGGAGAAGAGDGAVAGDRQRKDGGADRAAGGHDGAHHGRGVAARGHPAADRRHEHAHGGLHRQQHPLHIPLLATVLHQGVPAPGHRLRRLDCKKQNA